MASDSSSLTPGQIRAITQRLAAVGITSLKEPQIEYALRAKSSDGDVEKAIDLLVLFEDSLEGILKAYDPRVQLLGAENRESVTCYLDALLFAMFARLDSFEAMLFDAFNDEPRRRLAALLRLWVNLLRSGRLITVDIVQDPRSLAHFNSTTLTDLHRRSICRRHLEAVAGQTPPGCTNRTLLKHSPSSLGSWSCRC